MRFFSIVSAFMVSAAIAAPMEVAARNAAPSVQVAAPETNNVAARDNDRAAEMVRALVQKVKSIDASQVVDSLKKHDIIKRDDSDNSTTTTISTDNLVTKVESLLKNGVSEFVGDAGNFKTLIADVTNGSTFSLLGDFSTIISGAATLLDGDAPKITNQLLTSKLINVLGQQTTYDTLMPLLKNAKPLAQKEFIDNVVDLVDGVAPIVKFIGEILNWLAEL